MKILSKYTRLKAYVVLRVFSNIIRSVNPYLHTITYTMLTNSTHWDDFAPLQRQLKKVPAREAIEDGKGRWPLHRIICPTLMH